MVIVRKTDTGVSRLRSVSAGELAMLAFFVLLAVFMLREITTYSEGKVLVPIIVVSALLAVSLVLLAACFSPRAAPEPQLYPPDGLGPTENRRTGVGTGLWSRHGAVLSAAPLCMLFGIVRGLGIWVFMVTFWLIPPGRRMTRAALVGVLATVIIVYAMLYLVTVVLGLRLPYGYFI